MTTLDILRAARALIAAPGGWTQKVHARNPSGSPCLSSDASAISFCAVGALFRICPIPARYEAARLAFTEPLAERGETSLANWNDRIFRTQADAVALYDAAIARLEAAQ